MPTAPVLTGKEPAGLLSFIVTPTTATGEIDIDRLRGLADEQIAAGSDGVTLFGSTGAIGSFAEEERKAAAEALVRHVSGRAQVMIGTGAITTAEAVRLSEHAQSVGADSVLVVPISYWVLTDDELLSHYKTIAGAVRLPVMLYNNPRLSGNDLLPHVVTQLADVPNIRAIKETAPDMLRVSLYSRTLAGRLRVFAGRDVAAFEMLAIGAEGWASAFTNVAPRLCAELLRLVRGGDIEAARALSHRLAPLGEFAMAKGLVRLCHGAYEIMGRPVGRPRPPIGVLSAEEMKQLEAVLAGLGDATAPLRKIEAAA